MILNPEIVFAKIKGNIRLKRLFQLLFIALTKPGHVKKTLLAKNTLIAVAAVILFLVIGFLMWGETGADAEFMHPTTKYAMWAFIIGALVTISLPLGAI